MYDVIYFNVWSDIICTAAKLLHGTSAFSPLFCYGVFFCLLQLFVRQVRVVFLVEVTQRGGLHLSFEEACRYILPEKVLTSLK